MQLLHSPQGVGADAGFTIEAFCQDAGNGCFTYTARSGKQKGMVQAILVETVDQGLRNMFLPDELLERFSGAICAPVPGNS